MVLRKKQSYFISIAYNICILISYTIFNQVMNTEWDGFVISQAVLNTWGKFRNQVLSLKMSFPLQPYVFLRPPFVRVTHGRIYSEVTSFFEHVTHTVRLYNVPGKETAWLSIT